MRVRVPVQAQIVIPGENRAVARGSTKNRVMARLDRATQPERVRAPMTHQRADARLLGGPLSRAMTRVTDPSRMTGGEYPPQFPMVRKGTLAGRMGGRSPPHFLKTNAGRGEGGAPFRENKDQDAVVFGTRGRDVAPVFTSPLWGGRNLRARPSRARANFGWGDSPSPRPPPASLRSATSPHGGGGRTLRASASPRENRPMPRGVSARLTSIINGWWSN